MKGDDLKLPLGHPAFASWQAPGFPCSEVIPPRRGGGDALPLFREGSYEISPLFGEVQVDTCKASTQTLMSETVPISITGANNLFLIIHSFF